MTLIPRQFTAVLPALEMAIAESGNSGLAAGQVDAYVRAIHRKWKFAKQHLDLLAGIDWRCVGNLGRRMPGSSEPECLVIKLPEATLHIHHPTAVIDHVYVAFDGLTAAVCNMTDTLGRLLNAVYRLDIDERRASLFAIRDGCTPTSPLGSVLRDSAHTSWITALKNLRGRCQHADVEEVLVKIAGVYAAPTEPRVLLDYAWTMPKEHTPILEYSRQSLGAVESTLAACIDAISARPDCPHQ